MSKADSTHRDATSFYIKVCTVIQDLEYAYNLEKKV